MIKKLHIAFFLNVLIIALFSCQQESSVLIEPSNIDILNSNTPVTNLIKRVTLHDGSIDNIIDNANCFSVELPVKVVVNGKALTINTEADYNLIETIFDEFGDDSDSLTIVFPIKIILSDFSKITIENLNILKEYAANCNGENEIDDDIECLDFIYPISISIYNSSNQIAETKTLQSDEQLHSLIEDVKEYYIVQIVFPISVVLYNGTTLTINSMQQLETEIDEVKGMCNEDDNYDYNDDCESCTTQQINDLLLTCNWFVEKLKISDNDKTDEYSNLLVTFSANGIVSAKKNNTVYNGTWEISSLNNTLKLNLILPDFSELSANWELKEISDNKELEFIYNNNKLDLEKKCD